MRVSVEELEGRLGEATREITDLTADYVQLKESHKHLQGMAHTSLMPFSDQACILSLTRLPFP